MICGIGSAIFQISPGISYNFLLNLKPILAGLKTKNENPVYSVLSFEMTNGNYNFIRKASL